MQYKFSWVQGSGGIIVWLRISTRVQFLWQSKTKVELNWTFVICWSTWTHSFWEHLCLTGIMNGFMWFNPGAAQKHFQMSFSGSESQKVNDNSSTLTAPNLNANAAAGSTRSIFLCVLQRFLFKIVFWSRSENWKASGLCCWCPEGFEASCYLMNG